MTFLKKILKSFKSILAFSERTTRATANIQALMNERNELLVKMEEMNLANKKSKETITLLKEDKTKLENTVLEKDREITHLMNLRADADNTKKTIYKENRLLKQRLLSLKKFSHRAKEYQDEKMKMLMKENETIRNEKEDLVKHLANMLEQVNQMSLEEDHFRSTTAMNVAKYEAIKYENQELKESLSFLQLEREAVLVELSTKNEDKKWENDDAMRVVGRKNLRDVTNLTRVLNL